MNSAMVAVLFNERVAVGTADQCWEWSGSRFRTGYGRLKIDGKTTSAHRLSWMLHNGPIPDGTCVCHRCDNPPCVNPEHLFLGTKADNNLDRDAKGRTARGDRNGARLHPETRARGDRNGSRLHADRLARGERHGSRTCPDRVPRAERSGRYTKPERTARGDRHGARLHPESRPRGDQHHTRRHPEMLVRGEAHPWSKLTDEQVAALREQFATGSLRGRKLARAFGIGTSQMYRLVKGQSRK